eukprot:TRINITY_DN20508_c0_g1_i1.p1 TRINITY_DN20508_c0_g1~~TRINITY_DN20508_c0_g1_i1.p1  ORF type:complete len:863 (-),score=157.93 TRINITY_DN20508_c0_g1_i1:288-2876(-)
MALPRVGSAPMLSPPPSLPLAGGAARSASQGPATRTSFAPGAALLPPSTTILAGTQSVPAAGVYTPVVAAVPSFQTMPVQPVFSSAVLPTVMSTATQPAAASRPPATLLPSTSTQIMPMPATPPAALSPSHSTQVLPRAPTVIATTPFASMPSSASQLPPAPTLQLSSPAAASQSLPATVITPAQVGSPRMQSTPAALSPQAFSPASSASSLPPSGRNPFQTFNHDGLLSMQAAAMMPPGSMPMMPGTSMPRLAEVLTVQISRLLDMPLRAAGRGVRQKYRVHAYDEKMQRLDRSNVITGLPAEMAPNMPAESFDVEKEAGTLELWTHSRVVFLEVVVEGGHRTGGVVGRCQINRFDPRSAQFWPYALQDVMTGMPANSGLELRVVEGPKEMLEKTPATSPRGGSLPPTAGVRPQMPPAMAPPSGGLPGSSIYPTPGFNPMPGVQKAMEQNWHNVIGFLEVMVCKDMAVPKDPRMDRVCVSVLVEEHGDKKEVKRMGPFPAQRMGSSGLVQADCMRCVVTIKAPLHFGGTARDGAIYARLRVAYVAPNGSEQVIGETPAMMICFRPLQGQYYELVQKRTEGHAESIMGGVTVSHWLTTDQDVVRSGILDPRMLPFSRAEVAMAKEPPTVIHARSGNFPPLSKEDAFEQSAINAEVQNRAMFQRCKMADPKSHVKSDLEHFDGKFREWANLDSLFATMGPNPLSLDESLGASLTRGYQENTTIMKEIGRQVGPVNNRVDADVNTSVVGQVHPASAFKVQSTIRPVVCKDPDEIAATGDMRWMPDPPVYVPVKDMRPDDKETLRLSCYDPSSSAKLGFSDVNPNYNIRQDIWGPLQDVRAKPVAFVEHPEWFRRRRVKDDCLMS